MAARIKHGTATGSVQTVTLTGATSGDVIDVLARSGGPLWITYGVEPADPTAAGDDVDVCPSGGSVRLDPVLDDLDGKPFVVKVLADSGVTYTIKAGRP